MRSDLACTGVWYIGGYASSWPPLRFVSGCLLAVRLALGVMPVQQALIIEIDWGLYVCAFFDWARERGVFFDQFAQAFPTQVE